MPVIVGDDDDGSERRFGCGVLGEGTPWQFDDGRGDGPQNVNSIGVLGMLGSAADLSSFIGDTLGDNMELPISSAVFGYNVTGYDASATGVVPSFGFIAGSHPRYGAAGLYGESNTRGAIGVAAGAVGVGVVGLASQNGANLDANSGGTGVLGSGYIGIRGETAAGVAVLGQASGQGLAGLFAGNVQVTGNVTVAGDVRVDGDLFLKNRDMCERFPAASSTALKKGMVMVVNDTGLLAPCTCPYDPRVMGVISGAGHCGPPSRLGPIKILPQRFRLLWLEQHFVLPMRLRRRSKSVTS